MAKVVTFGYDKRFNNRMKERLEKMKVDKKFIRLNEFGQMGVDALQAATPVRTGKTANSWYYEIYEEAGETHLVWYNTNVNKGVNVAVIVDSGHAALDGSWTPGYNYIESAISPVIEKINKYFGEEG
ncbi:MAG: HK97 gp10 family phage protein [Bacilli bacterium]|nr:HK97 gp10 family phage protein [Bacilli bacterium]